ncbi:hypothetical protein ACFQPF_12230 [Fictibacillus iocasae]|uniref:Uncharacterized protein n=1 Tax=Fictibacillus iocasae TaxID=2715437 RepID=A0ABW2NPP9_9BACL
MMAKKLNKININSDLIDAFRNKVNETDFFSGKLKNVNGKNHWNLLCSAMDWITVASDGLPEIKLEIGGMGYNHLKTINLMQYVITVDVLVESIIQLYRVLNSGEPYPLDDSKNIFCHEELSDDKYFKHIRAVFSTHPVSLKSFDGVKRSNDERYFASWVSEMPDIVDEYDFYVFLYSNDPNKDSLNSFGINLDKVNEFALQRYELLNDLINRVDIIIKEHITNYKEKSIPESDDIIEQLSILAEENEKRFGKGYGYSYEIHYLQKLFITEVEMYGFDEKFTAILNDYKDYMITGINEIKRNLQTMSDHGYYIKHRAGGYEFEKIYTYFADGNHPIGKEYFQGLINLEKLPIKLIELNDMQLNRLMMDAYLFSVCEETGNERIKLGDIVELVYPNYK